MNGYYQDGSYYTTKLGPIVFTVVPTVDILACKSCKHGIYSRWSSKYQHSYDCKLLKDGLPCKHEPIEEMVE